MGVISIICKFLTYFIEVKILIPSSQTKEQSKDKRQDYNMK